MGGLQSPLWWDLVAVPHLGRDRRAPSTCHNQRRAVPEGSGVVQEGPRAMGGLPGLLLPPLGQLLNLVAPSCQDRRKSRNKALSRETLRALLRQCKGSVRKGGIWHRGHALVGNPAPNGLPASGSHPNSSRPSSLPLLLPAGDWHPARGRAVRGLIALGTSPPSFQELGTGKLEAGWRMMEVLMGRGPWRAPKPTDPSYTTGHHQKLFGSGVFAVTWGCH